MATNPANHFLDSAVGMVEEARSKVLEMEKKYPKWAKHTAQLLDGAIAKATRDIEFCNEEDIAEIENNPHDVFWTP